MITNKTRTDSLIGNQTNLKPQAEKFPQAQKINGAAKGKLRRHIISQSMFSLSMTSDTCLYNVYLPVL